MNSSSVLRSNVAPVINSISVDFDERRVRSADRASAVCGADAGNFGLMAGSVAHDINNLLMAISGFAHSIKSSPASSGGQHRFAEEIEKAVERAAALTSKLVGSSRGAAQAASAVSMNSLVRDVEAMARQLAGQSVEVRCELAGDLGLVTGDAAQLERVIINLITNARDAMPEGGAITIRTENISLPRGPEASPQGGRLRGACVQLSVSDTGSGIPEHIRSQIFDPFFTTKSPGRGTGLGLATCREIIERCGGEIRAESEMGRGTVMTIVLPRQQDVAAPVPAVAEVAGVRTSVSQGSETILVVDNEPAVAGLIATVLRNAGYQVLKAVNGLDGLRVFNEHRGAEIALVITDLVMPQMGGFAMVAELRRQRPGLRTLFLSGYSRDTLCDEGMLAPDDALIEKPFTAASLTSRVRAILDITLEDAVATLKRAA